MAQDLPTVLYVDDLPMNLKLFEAAFKKDYHIILTETPADALRILEEQEVQVLVSDQRMPEMTGTELLELVAERFPDVRRYLLTAFTDVDTILEAVNRGRIHGYIKKPMDKVEIINSINNSLESYYLRKQNQQMMGELEHANKELMNLDGLKSEIIHSISHEIRNPLNRIMGTLHLLKNKIEGDELSEVVNILDNSVSKLEGFSLLTRQISLLKSPGYQLKKSRLSIKQVIQFSVIETNEDIKENDMNLKLDIKVANAYVEGESGLLVSCLASLIQFAIEHTDKGGEITVVAEMDNEHLVCRVTDRGADYSDALVENLTAQFSSNNAALNLNMGIGLALSQMIMEAHQGNVRFEKTGDGFGCLMMEFPQKASPN